MKKLPWLTIEQRKILNERIDIAVTECNRRHWGWFADGKSNAVTKKIHVSDIRGLLLATGILRYTLNKFDTDIYYRGQRKDWPIVPSLYRGLKTREDVDNMESILYSALNELKENFDPKGTNEEREALAQHYGLKTRWIDVVDHIQTAAWFAYFDFNREVDYNKYFLSKSNPNECCYDDDVGYIYVLAVPRDGIRAKCIDLRKKPSNWLRPHIQQSQSIKVDIPGRGCGNIHYIVVACFVVQRNDLRLWSNIDVITPDFFFPNCFQDTGLMHWINAKSHLVKQEIDVSIISF